MSTATLNRSRLAARCAELPDLDEAELGARVLAALPTHESRPAGLLREWAEAASRFGTELADEAGVSGVSGADSLVSQVGLQVVQEAGGLTRTRLTLAQYGTRPPAVRVYSDAVAVAEEVVELLGWRAWFPPGSVRDIGVCHEVAHHLLHGRPGAALKRSPRPRGAPHGPDDGARARHRSRRDSRAQLRTSHLRAAQEPPADQPGPQRGLRDRGSRAAAARPRWKGGLTWLPELSWSWSSVWCSC